jgi:prevent-host-death family protein
MTSISIRDARAHLAHLIDQVEAGQVVSITRRGQEVARIVPVAQVAKPLPQRAAARAAMVQRGATVTGSTIAIIRAEERW